MAKKEFTYRGKTMEELKALSLPELKKLLPSRQRRKLVRGLTTEEKIFLKKFQSEKKHVLETHCRTMIVLPEMIGSVIKIYNGKQFIPITIIPEMIGHYFGEYALTRTRVKHSAPGVGATRSSASVSVR